MNTPTQNHEWSSSNITYFRIQQFFPLRFQKKPNPIYRSVKSGATNQNGDHHYVGENGQEVCHLSRTLYAFDDCQENDDPAEQQVQSQPPIWQSNAVVDVVFLLQNFTAESANPKSDKNARMKVDMVDSLQKIQFRTADALVATRCSHIG
jgi:hypothetical protein